MANRSYQRNLSPALLLTSGDGTVARVECAAPGCSTADQWRINGRLPPAGIVKTHFTRRGWEISRKATCPACQRKPKMAVTTPDAAPTKPANAALASVSKSTEAALEAKQLTMMALMDSYDAARKTYKNGKTDKSIGVDCGIAETMVKQIREEFFGPLSVPDEVQALRDEAALAMKAATDLTKRLDALCLRNGWIA